MNRERTYRTGEQIHEGDVVRNGAWEGMLESVVTSEISDWPDCWSEHGERPMLIEPSFGGLYTKFYDEHLVSVHRKHA
jgi:hypothetical protein